MAQSILVFDFGANEAAAQQARHKVEAWKQGFRLGDKMLLKFEREETAAHTPETARNAEPEPVEPAKSSTAAAKSVKTRSRAKAAAKQAKSVSKPAAETAKEESSAPPDGKVRLLVRLDFSDHEKLSHQRWLDRIPAEEPFKSVTGKTIRAGDPEFTKTSELFESLE